jgi:hypothetical protein
LELISTAINQGIFTTIVECAAEWITVTHPKMIQDEAKPLKERADILHDQAVEEKILHLVMEEGPQASV